MLTLDTTLFRHQKNLLAFSAGVDSCALFFLLLEHNISFDIAIVNYGLRKQSQEEVAYAKHLAKAYHLTCYTINAPIYTKNFEKNARDFRYTFFETLIQTHHYTTLLTAHQLNDQLEWFLMRLTKGAGVSELIGLQEITKKDNYVLLRPLLSYSKEELLAYLNQHHHSYFIDESNHSDKYERNHFRKEFSDPLLKVYKEGIKRSFSYLQEEKKELEKGFETIYNQKELYILKIHTSFSKTKAIDLTLKKLGYLLSASQRKKIKEKTSLVIGGIWAVESKDDLVYIAPYKISPMPKKFKESCRVAKIPQKIRAYCFEEKIALIKLLH